ncbi:MAG TPA: glycosyltransferase [Phycisphaerae bacterium]|nr:glycosyltransferase [Phycisphaerae bacterium]
MRILVITNFYPPHHIGGYELRCREVVDGLRSRGHAVRVLTGRYASGSVGGAEPHVHRKLHLSWGPPYPPEDLAGLLGAEAADHRALADLCADFRPEIIDVWGMEFASQSLVAALPASCMPVHLWLEDNWLLDGWSRDPLCQVAGVAERMGVVMEGAFGALCCPAGARGHAADAPITFVTSALKDYYAKAGLVCPNSRVRPGGIDMATFRDLPGAPPPPPFVIVHAGQLTESRGQNDLIAAAGLAATDTRCPFPVVVRIAGGGSPGYVAELRRLADEHRSERFRVEFVGILPPDRMPELYATGHLFVFTSRRAFEGLPRVMVEAMAAGLPMIATDTGGQRDILADGRWGPLLPPGDRERLVRHILEAMTDYPARLERAREAREDAFERFDVEKCIEAYAADLTRVAASQKASEDEEHRTETAAFPLVTREEAGKLVETIGRAARQASVDAERDPEQAWRLAVVLKRTGQLAEAEKLLRSLHESYADDPVHVRRATFHLAELAMPAGRWPDAQELLEACLSVAPDHRKAAYDLDHACRRTLPEHLAGLARQ